MRSKEEIQESIKSFTERLINLQIEKKEIDNQIKDLKQEYKEEGINVSMVSKVINDIKKEIKKSESDKFEEEIIREWLSSDELRTIIESLVDL